MKIKKIICVFLLFILMINLLFPTIYAISQDNIIKENNSSIEDEMNSDDEKENEDNSEDDNKQDNQIEDKDEENKTQQDQIQNNDIKDKDNEQIESDLQQVQSPVDINKNNQIDNTDQVNLMSSSGKVNYSTHIQNVGWQNWKSDGQMSGTSGLGYRLESIQIKLDNVPADAGIKYKVHIQNLGWQNWKKNGEQAGTTGLGYRLEAIQIELENMDQYTIMYRTHVQNVGWQEWVYDGDISGTSGKGYRLEAIEIKIVNKKQKPMYIAYNSHIQNEGWEPDGSVRFGETSGSIGKFQRLEAIKVNLVNVPKDAKIKYQVHIQNIGWQEWKEDGQMAGTSGLGYRLEAIKIQLENFPNYSVMYRTHVQGVGWQNWMYDGQIAGTTGLGYRLEGIQIKLVPKVDKGIMGIESPNNNADINSNKIDLIGWCMSNTKQDSIKIKVDDNLINPNIIRKHRVDVLNNIPGYGGLEMNPNTGFETQLDLTNYADGKHKIKTELYSENGKLLDTKEVTINLDRTMRIMYQTHVQNIGWQNWVKNNELAGTTGEFLRIEALKIQTINVPENIQLQYNAHVQNIGWQGWKQNGQIAGTIGEGLRIEALKIRLIDKNTNQEVDNISVEYQTHVQGIGWQSSKVDGEEAGTIGKGFRIEALKIRLSNVKLPRGKIDIESPQRTVFTGSSISIKGWCMSTQSSQDVIEVYIDGNKTSLTVNRTPRQDVIKNVTFYGDGSVNPTPGYDFTLNLNNISAGSHQIKINLYSKNKARLLDTITKQIQVVKDIYWGVDVSAHQKNINWSAVKNEGTNYAIIRIGWVGNVSNKKDDFFEANYNSCKKNGIPFGIYVYSYSTSVESARNEAYTVLNWLNGRHIDLPIFWDVEDPSQAQLDKDTLTAMADTFGSIIQNAGYKAGIYSSKNWLTNKLDMSYLETKYDVWVAQYYHECTYNGRYDIWQYSSEGRLSGINGNVDSNWFYKRY